MSDEEKTNSESRTKVFDFFGLRSSGVPGALKRAVKKIVDKDPDMFAKAIDAHHKRVVAQQKSDEKAEKTEKAEAAKKLAKKASKKKH